MSMAKAMRVRNAARNAAREANNVTVMCVEKDKRRAKKAMPVADTTPITNKIGKC